MFRVQRFSSLSRRLYSRLFPQRFYDLRFTLSVKSENGIPQSAAPLEFFRIFRSKQFLDVCRFLPQDHSSFFLFFLKISLDLLDLPLG